MANKKRGKFAVFLLMLAMAACAGCSKNSGSEEAKKEAVEDGAAREDDAGETEAAETEAAEGQTDPADGKELKVPRTKEEQEEAFGTVDKNGKWTPPEGSYVDPKTGNILNKDGVVVGTTQKPHAARPGSKG